MAKQQFIWKDFSPSSLEMIARANGIINTYAQQGYSLSLRQLYYQFVTRNWIPNTEQNYKRLGSIINDGRLAGLVDWDAIVDRGRETVIPPHYRDPKHILDVASRSFAIDKWADQPNHVEVMVEKQALEGVLIPVCQEVDVPFTANKGYSSASALYEASRRMLRAMNEGKVIHILYLGDHDPSGIDMTRDVKERVSLFLGVNWMAEDRTVYIDPRYSDRLEVHRLALNMDQVDRYHPPENPAKVTDSRANGYIALFGSSSWELDALEPTVLAGLVRDAVLDLRDEDLWEDARAREAEMRGYLEDVANNWRAS